MDSEFPDEDVMAANEDSHCRWKLYFDGAANAIVSGIGAVLVSPKGQQTPIAVKLGFDCTNNMTEYKACIVGLQAALEFGAHELEVFGDSLLIVSQTNRKWNAWHPKFIPYQRYISQLIPKFKYVTLTNTPSDGNQGGPSLKDPLQVLDGPIARSRAKKIKEAMQGLVQSTWDETRKSPTIKVGLKEGEPISIHLI